MAMDRNKQSESADVTLPSPGENTLPMKLIQEESSASKEGIPGRILLCFSLYTNIGKVLSTKQAPGSNKCLHGIRFISMSWVILAHTYYVAAWYFDDNVEVTETTQTLSFQAIGNSSVSVDSFFFLSGLLMTYLLIKQMEKSKERGKPVSYWMVYLHRYLRLTPTYMFNMMLYMWVLPYMFSGPFWLPADEFDPGCVANWWTNLLYINNLVNADNACMGPTWYLANDMQFFIIGVPVVYILYRWEIFGIVLKLVLLLASFVTTAVITSHYDMKVPDGDDVLYYVKPYCRIGSYLVGVSVGWLLVKIKRKQTKSMTMRLLMTVGWLVAATTALTVLYSAYGIYNGTTLQTEAENVVYLTVARTFWAMALGWVVLACHHGYGGVVDIILSWGGWVPLSRLNYCAYLIHYMVIWTVYAIRETTIHLTTSNMIYFFMGHLNLSYGLAFLVSVAVEIPLMEVEKIVFNKFR